MIKVKVCGNLDPVNVSAVASADPDMMGFIFYRGSERFVGDPPAALWEAVPASIEKVGVFVDEDLQQVRELIARYDFSMVQLHGNETAAYCGQLRKTGMRVIKAFGMGASFDFDRLLPYRQACDYFLFDTASPEHGGSGRKFNWEVLKDYSLEVPFFLSGGIGPSDWHDILAIGNDRLFAVDINSRFESAPGIKLAGLVKQFIHDIKSLQQ
jgi:phosphoribosylanthranilate isomerase